MVRKLKRVWLAQYDVIKGKKSKTAIKYSITLGITSKMPDAVKSFDSELNRLYPGFKIDIYKIEDLGLTAVIGK